MGRMKYFGTGLDRQITASDVCEASPGYSRKLWSTVSQAEAQEERKMAQRNVRILAAAASKPGPHNTKTEIVFLRTLKQKADDKGSDGGDKLTARKVRRTANVFQGSEHVWGVLSI